MKVWIVVMTFRTKCFQPFYLHSASYSCHLVWILKQDIPLSSNEVLLFWPQALPDSSLFLDSGSIFIRLLKIPLVVVILEVVGSSFILWELMMCAGETGSDGQVISRCFTGVLLYRRNTSAASLSLSVSSFQSCGSRKQTSLWQQIHFCTHFEKEMVMVAAFKFTDCQISFDRSCWQSRTFLFTSS